MQKQNNVYALIYNQTQIRKHWQMALQRIKCVSFLFLHFLQGLLVKEPLYFVLFPQNILSSAAQTATN